jgi:hypothetical protein
MGTSSPRFKEGAQSPASLSEPSHLNSDQRDALYCNLLTAITSSHGGSAQSITLTKDQLTMARNRALVVDSDGGGGLTLRVAPIETNC